MTTAAVDFTPGVLQEGDPRWQAIAQQRLALHRHVSLSTHVYRGEPWVVALDEASGVSHRFSAAAWRIAALLDGRHTLAEVLAAARRSPGGEQLGEGEVVDLLTRLQRAELLNITRSAPRALLTGRMSARRRARAMLRWRGPVSVRVPLVDPDRWLAGPAAWLAPWWSRGLLAAFGLVVTAAVAAALANATAIAEQWQAQASDPRVWIALLLAYPLIKALHEIGHALAIKTFGGAVHEMGVMFIAFLPLPYVEASAANSFSSRRARMAVSAAGIAVELAIAGLAMLAWLVFPHGTLGATLLGIAAIGSLSTLLFNGNPLLRFDGYYLLVDAIEIPGLYSRSAAYLRYLACRYLFGLVDAHSPVTAAGERRWFIGYGLASFAYRLFIVTAIALFVSSKAFVLGVMLALWFVAVQVLGPMTKMFRFILLDGRLQGRRARALAVIAGAFALVALALTVPVPYSTSAPGVVELPRSSVVRAAAEGFVRDLTRADGEHVAPGQQLLVLENEELTAVGEPSLVEAHVPDDDVRPGRPRLGVSRLITRSDVPAQRASVPGPQTARRPAERRDRRGGLQCVSRSLGRQVGRSDAACRRAASSAIARISPPKRSEISRRVW